MLCLTVVVEQCYNPRARSIDHVIAFDDPFRSIVSCLDIWRSWQRKRHRRQCGEHYGRNIRLHYLLSTTNLMVSLQLLSEHCLVKCRLLKPSTTVDCTKE